MTLRAGWWFTVSGWYLRVLLTEGTNYLIVHRVSDLGILHKINGCMPIKSPLRCCALRPTIRASPALSTNALYTSIYQAWLYSFKGFTRRISFGFSNGKHVLKCRRLHLRSLIGASPHAPQSLRRCIQHQLLQYRWSANLILPVIMIAW